MKRFLLLVLSLITGCELSSDVPGCIGGWFEFTCVYNKKPERIDVHRPKAATIQSTTMDDWESHENIHLYHDTAKKLLRVVVNKLERKHFGNYFCTIGKQSTPKISLEREDDSDCQRRLYQTVYVTATTNFTCSRPESSSVMFLCKKEGFNCKEILLSSPVSDGRFTLTVNNRVFSVALEHVSAQDAGVYWCGQKFNRENSQTAVKEILLEVLNIPTRTASVTVGKTLTYSCQYDGSVPIKKFVCKGENTSTCEHLVTTAGPKNQRFSIKDDRIKTITITLKDLTMDDAGVYWCGAENTHPRGNDHFFQKLELTVVPLPSTTPSVHLKTHSSHPYSTSSPGSTTVTKLSISWLIGAIIAVICVAVLVFVLVLFCRRVEGSKNTTNGGAQNEDHCYAEIQESDSRTAPTSFYVTANFPTNPCSSSHCSTVQVPNGSCSTVTGNNSQTPMVYSTVNGPSTLTETTVYYNANNPQQE